MPEKTLLKQIAELLEVEFTPLLDGRSVQHLSAHPGI